MLHYRKDEHIVNCTMKTSHVIQYSCYLPHCTDPIGFHSSFPGLKSSKLSAWSSTGRAFGIDISPLHQLPNGRRCWLIHCDAEFYVLRSTFQNIYLWVATREIKYAVNTLTFGCVFNEAIEIISTKLQYSCQINPHYGFWKTLKATRCLPEQDLMGLMVSPNIRHFSILILSCLARMTVLRLFR